MLLEYREKLISRNIETPQRIAFLANLDAFGVRIVLTPDNIHPVVSADPDDDTLLACAVVGHATHLITYDPHLLNLGKMYKGITILDGLHFLYAVRSDKLSSNNE